MSNCSSQAVMAAGLFALAKSESASYGAAVPAQAE